MALAFLPFDAALEEYGRQAAELLAGWQSGDASAVRVFRANHPAFLDVSIPWLERRMSEEEVRAVPIDAAAARLALARWYNFLDWPSLEAYALAVADRESVVGRFERAVEAVIDGDRETLRRLLAGYPELVHARSTRVNNFDPPQHRSTLLHYLAANGVENSRQRSPKNAVEVARSLLDAGADPNALQDSYGGCNTTLAMLVSSSPPREAGVQVPLVEVLVEYGASVAPMGEGTCADPLLTALVFGSRDAASALVRLGASVDSLPKAAGLGRHADVERLLPLANESQRHQALAVAAMLGQTESVRMLLDAGDDPNRHNPRGFHAHTTPLHQAIAGGHLDTVRLLVARGARTDIKDHIYQSTALGWADYLQQREIAAFLRGAGDSGGSGGQVTNSAPPGTV
jgi:ankyrin repeat protein